MSKFGYAGAILDVDLSCDRIVNLSTDDYADRFIGGRGLAAKLYWDKVSPQSKAFDPDNCIVFATGPTAGFTRLAGSRWKICGKSPTMEPQSFSYSNLGGSFGAWLKFSGYDAIAVQGSSDKPLYLYVHDGKAEIRDASSLWGKDAIQTREILKAELGKEARILAIGPAGENMVRFTTILADENSSGSSGFGSVMGSKKLKAIAVVGDKRPIAANPDKLHELSDRIYPLRKDQWNFPHKWIHEGKTKKGVCWGCSTGCIRTNYDFGDGRQVKFFCQAADMYEEKAIKYYGAWNEVVAHAADLCNRYSLDTFVLEPLIAWLDRCYQEGILSEKETGLPLSKIGSAEFIETLVRKIALREGFGDILAQGTFKAAEIVGRGAGKLIGDSITTTANDLAMYDPRLYIAHALLYAMEPRKPIQELHEISMVMLQWAGLADSNVGLFDKHPGLLSSQAICDIVEKFWGGRTAGDLSTYEGKALAAKNIQDRTSAKESLVLCDFLFPITWIRGEEALVGDPTMESQVFSAVTGRETDVDGLNRLGERTFNLQRAIRIREGWEGRKGDRLLDAFHDIPNQTARFNPDCLVPGKTGQAVSRKGAVVDRDKFEEMKSEYYQLRGWDVASGLQTMTKLKELDMADVASDLQKRGLLK